MTHDDIIRMARSVRDGGHWNQIDIINFGRMIALAEREACAKVVLQMQEAAPDDGISGWTAADAIRARGKK
jgi:hypothetical protein